MGLVVNCPGHLCWKKNLPDFHGREINRESLAMKVAASLLAQGEFDFGLRSEGSYEIKLLNGFSLICPTLSRSYNFVSESVQA